MGKTVIELVTAILVLAGVLIGLNKTGVVDVPGINQVPVFQPDIEIPDIPTPATKVAVPDVRGYLLADAEEEIEGRGLVVQSVDSIAKELCQEQGLVDHTLPPAGVSIGEGAGVVVYVCG